MACVVTKHLKEIFLLHRWQRAQGQIFAPSIFSIRACFQTSLECSGLCVGKGWKKKKKAKIPFILRYSYQAAMSVSFSPLLSLKAISCYATSSGSSDHQNMRAWGHFDVIQGGGGKPHHYRYHAASGISKWPFMVASFPLHFRPSDFLSRDANPASQHLSHTLSSVNRLVYMHTTHFLTPLHFPFQWLSLSVISSMNRQCCKACLKNSCWLLQT